MGTSIPVILDSFSWPTKAEAENAYREILRDPRYAVYDTISDAVHKRMLFELVERHPEAGDKIGSGIKRFFIGRTIDGDRKHVSPNATGIWIERDNGKREDFSYITAIRGHTPRSRVKEALRLAVEDFRIDYRDARFAGGTPVLSDLSGTSIASRKDAVVVYTAPTWEQLSYRFAMSEGGWEKLEIHAGGGEVQIGSKLVSLDAENRWIDFYQLHANLGIATASESAQRNRSDETAWTP